MSLLRAFKLSSEQLEEISNRAIRVCWALELLEFGHSYPYFRSSDVPDRASVQYTVATNRLGEWYGENVIYSEIS